MKSTAKFLPLLIVLSLVASSLLISSLFAADGTVALDKAFITTPDGLVKATLTDSDLNVGVVQLNEASGFDAAPVGNYNFPLGGLGCTNLGNAGSECRYRVKKFPILDSGNGAGINFLDVTSTPIGMPPPFPALAVVNVDSSDGVVAIRNVGTVPVLPTDFTLTYTAADVQTHTVRITSPKDNTGFDLTLLETGADTGVFEGTFRTHDATRSAIDISGGVTEDSLGLDLNGDGDLLDTATSTTEALLGQDLNGDGDAVDVTNVTVLNVNTLPNFTVRPRVAAIAGAKVTVTYDDEGTNRLAEAVVETVLPVVTHVSPLDDAATDQTNALLRAQITDSDSGVDETTITFNVNRILPGDVLGPAVAVTAPVDTDPITAGFQAEVRIVEELLGGGVGDGESPLQWSVTVTDVAGNVKTSDPFKLLIDTVPPTLALGIQAETGHSLDADGVLVDAPAGALRTSVRLIFNEALDGLVADGGSIDSSDFEVNDATPASVNWSSAHPESVFLTIPELPSPSARPKVEMVGIVKDRAGNEQRSVLTVAEAADGISPTLAVTLSPSSALDKESVSIEVIVDETLLTTPVITVTDGGGADVTATRGQISVDPLNPNRFTTSFDPTAASGAFTVKVDAQDTSANAATIGDNDVAADGAIKFEIDSTIVAPATNFPGKNDAANVFTVNPFLDLDFATEGTEYTADGQALVNINAITLNGDDVSASLNREGDGKFVLALRDLALQDHELKLTATDSAGNELLDHTVAFTVKDRPDFAVPLIPGWNLVSFPGEPADAAINAIIPSSDPTVDQVLTYDPAEAGAWLVAVRGDDGLMGGTLTTMSANRAYWVHSSSFKALSVKIPLLQGGAAQLLPTINLVKGWNLVGIIDVSGESVAGDTVGSINTYMKGVTPPSTIYEYLAREDRFQGLGGATDIAAAAGPPVVRAQGAVVGLGFWMYMPSAGILVP